MKKAKEILQKILIIAQKILAVAQKILKKLKALALFLYKHLCFYRKEVLITLGLIVAFYGSYKGVGLIGTRVFYYQNQFQSGIITDRRRIKTIPPESSLQAYVRMYFSGGQVYQARLPYEGRQRILGIYHDAAKDTLVIDWAAGFASSWQDDTLKEDTELFFQSLKKNFPIKNVRFLVEGRPAGLKWNEYSFDTGVPVGEEISPKK